MDDRAPVAELVIDGWRSGIRFAASHLVPHHPKCGRLHGHTYAIHCRIEGRVPGSGMILDFGVVKQALRGISDELDHHWVLPRDPAEGRVTVRDGLVRYEVGDKAYEVPETDVAFVDVPVCTAEFLAVHLIERLLKEVDFPDDVSKVCVGVDEGYGKGAWVERRP